MQINTKTMDKKYIAISICILLMILFLINFDFISARINTGFPKDILQNFTTVFISIILETMPFILLGAFISSLIQVFISEETISRLIPRNKFMGLFAASLMGFIFPVCECAIIPIARRLLRKGVPTGIVVTFMLAVPIVNPIVLLSTYYAFYNKPIMVLARGVLGLVIALFIGFLIGKLEEGRSPLINSGRLQRKHHYSYHSDHHHHEHAHTHIHGSHEGTGKSRISEIIEHTSIEFYDIGKYLIFGAMISASFQSFVSRGNILGLGYDEYISVAVMILLAFILSLCSEADAFVARSFMGQFTNGSITAFLIFGPMLDIKNMLMLNSTFKKGFIIRLVLMIFLICFAAGVMVNIIGI